MSKRVLTPAGGFLLALALGAAAWAGVIVGVIYLLEWLKAWPL